MNNVRSLPSYGTVMRHLEAWLTANGQTITADIETDPQLVTLIEDMNLWRGAGKPEEASWRRP